MNHKIIAYLMVAWAVASTLTALACYWPDPPVGLIGILQWAVPILMVGAILLFAGIGVRRSLRRPAATADINGVFSTEVALHLISKWGVRW